MRGWWLLLVSAITASVTKPTQSPVTRSPTRSPSTAVPTPPTTLAPSSSPSTLAPSAAPNTRAPSPPTMSAAPTPVPVPPNNTLCGVWSIANSSSSHCLPSQSCCAAGASGQCTSPLTASVTTFISQEDFQFATDGGYSIMFMVGTGGGTCPMTLASGVLISAVLTLGTYQKLGNNTALGGDWQKLIYNAESFEATLTKSNKAVFYTPGNYTLGGQLTGPCAQLDTLFNDPVQGCPCGANWTVSSFVNGTSPATRYINKTSCVNSNGTSTCPEGYYFRQDPRYGSYRVTYSSSVPNGTIDTRTLDITRPVFDSAAGWSDSVVYASFSADFTCPSQVSQKSSAPTSPSAAPSPRATSSGFVVIPSLGVLGLLGWM